MLFTHSLKATNPIRQNIRDHYRCDENTILEHLLPLAQINMDAKSRAWEHARKIVVNIRRDNVGSGGVDALLNEFSLSSDEGVVLMCLAEALLRVPDKVTADNLIRDKLANGDWSAHIGNSNSIFVNASSWGLLFTGKLVNYTDADKKEQFSVLKRTVGRLGEPVIRKAVRYAMKIMGTQFVMGRNIEEALKRAVEQETKGYLYSYDMLGEGARTMADANRYFEAYVNAIHRIGKVAQTLGPALNPEKSPGISIKLSAIHPRYEFSHRERVMTEIVPRLKELALLAKSYNIGLTVDAEEADRLDMSLDVIESVFLDNDLANWNGFGMAVQAYQKRAIFVIDWIREITQKANRKMMVRLVKGAYWDSEIKIAQTECLEDFPVFSRKPSTDVSYQACAKKLLGYRDTIYPQFATHNAYTVTTILEMTRDDYSGYEFQRLHGMGESLYDQVVQNYKVACRVYAPVGAHKELLAYLVRRLLENGANSSFVNNIVDDTIPVESLLSDPVETVKEWKNKYNPKIVMPIDLYGDERKNSNGIDLTNVDQITIMKVNLDSWFAKHKTNISTLTAGQHPVVNPANHNEVVGHITHADEAQMSEIVENAQTAFETWSQTDVEYRSDILCKTTDLLEKNCDELIALCIKEAGKIPVDSVAEIREAVDFCRYYAARANELMQDDTLAARGVVLAISPWNFPLAIFLGQVAAAIVVGNTVVAKPAEQTSLIALRAIELMHEAGLPQHVVQAVIAQGSVVGQVIVPDLRIKAVMFTGSTETGTRIAQTLAARGGDPVPLIAETGGQNCMIVDSTALPEQVVDDVVASGFQSAGQRCSALRVLFLQEDIADKVIAMIIGAMKELHVGNPAYLSTDIGPVIDQKAFDALTAHAAYLDDHPNAKMHYECDLPNMGKAGHFFFTPKLYEIDDLSVLTKEVFGPCIHIVRFKGDNVQGVINDVNNTGFGLTMGIHTRIDHKAKYLASRSRAGNVYINRNMIGAIVGVQPFGGRGLSGTGPKAGGPQYLTRLVCEKGVLPTPRYDDDFIAHINAKFSKTNDENVINDIIQKSQTAQHLWQHSDLNVRLSVLRQLLAYLSNNSAFTANEHFEHIIASASRLLIHANKKLKAPVILPGPTGELNELHLESRGTLIHVYDDRTSIEFWFISLIAALAAGNTVISVVCYDSKRDDDYSAGLKFNRIKEIHTGLTEIGIIDGVFQIADEQTLDAIITDQNIAGAIVDAKTPLMHVINDKLAARSGAIVPLINAAQHHNLFMRMVTEKTISTDTTAAGGNASLMTMEIED